MKFKRYTRQVIQVFMAVLLFSACKKDGPSSTEINTGILVSKTWQIQSVTVDGVDKTAQFSGLTLTFNSGTYSTTNGAVVWPASGTWSFKDNSGMVVTRNDGVDVTITSIAANSLVLELIWSRTTLGGGRFASLAGKHIFTFN